MTFLHVTNLASYTALKAKPKTRHTANKVNEDRKSANRTWSQSRWACGWDEAWAWSGSAPGTSYCVWAAKGLQFCSEIHRAEPSAADASSDRSDLEGLCLKTDICCKNPPCSKGFSQFGAPAVLLCFSLLSSGVSSAGAGLGAAG